MLSWLWLLLSLTGQSLSCDVFSVTGSSVGKNEDGCLLTDTGEYQCAFLQDALESLVVASTCSEIRLQPNVTYQIVRSVRVSINGSLTITTESSDNEDDERATISFALSATELNMTRIFEPLYVLTFEGMNFVLVSSVDFADSPGIISFQSVEQVTIADSSFR